MTEIQGKKKSNLILFIRLAITGLILYLLFSKIDFGGFSAVFSRISPGFLFLSFLIYAFQTLVSTIKWQKLVEILGLKLKLGYFLKFNLIGLFYATVLPGGLISGDLAKGYKIFKSANERGKLINSILMDRLTGFSGLLGLVPVIYFFEISRKFPGYWVFSIVSAAAFLAFVVFLLFSKKIHGFLAGPAKRISPKLDFFLEKIFSALDSYRKNISYAALAVLAGALIYFINTCSLYLLTIASGIKISFANLFIVNCLANLGLILAPLTFLGFGIREGMFVYFLAFAGVSRESALALSLSFGVITLIFNLLGGIPEAVDLIKKIFPLKQET